MVSRLRTMARRIIHSSKTAQTANMASRTRSTAAMDAFAESLTTFGEQYPHEIARTQAQRAGRG